MAIFKKQPPTLPVQKKITHKQDFSYSKGGCTLSFTLTEEHKELSDFKECLLEAIKDVDELMKGVK